MSILSIVEEDGQKNGKIFRPFSFLNLTLEYSEFRKHFVFHALTFVLGISLFFFFFYFSLLTLSSQNQAF